MTADHERQVILTGIGGQGVQLAGQVLARAALADGRHAQLFQSYGGLMRGGQTEASLVFGAHPVTAPPVLGSTWGAIAMHDAHWGQVSSRVRSSGVVMTNSSIVRDVGIADRDVTIVEVPATDLALHLGDSILASMIMVGAFAAVTDIASNDALEQGLRASLPSYRRDKAQQAVEAIHAGRELDDLPVVPAWDQAGVGP